jgi:ACS family hexuronate transporter-like MFS transporter
MAETEFSAKIKSATPAVAAMRMTVPYLRWWIVGLVFLATLINYIDRLTISVLAPVITKTLNLSALEYAGVGAWFLLAYTISQGVSGKLYDRIGARRGFALSITVWSLAAMAHALARGLGSLSAFRFLLGLGEAGNWPGAAKVIAEWFPTRERAFAMAIFNSGAAIGSIIAPPIIVWLQLRYGWQTTFIITGALGFFWLSLWLFCYQSPEKHRRLGEGEYRLIREESKAAGATRESKDGATGGRGDWAKSSPFESASFSPSPGLPVAPSTDSLSAPSPTWRELLRYKQVWALVLGRLLVDPVWWLFITWLPLFLNRVHGFDLKKIGLFAWVPFVAADAGSLLGGAASGFLIRKGWGVNCARKATIGFSALLMPAGILAARASDPMVALALIGLVLFGFQFWINNVQTLPSDYFSDKAVASVAGLGGVGAGIGSMIFILTTGWVVDHFGYTPVLTVAGVLAPVGTIVLFALAGEIKKLPFQIANSKSFAGENS